MASAHVVQVGASTEKPLEAPMSYQAITSVTTIVVGPQECQTYTSNRAHEKNLHMRTRAYDQAAVESLAQGWDRALLLAQTMWSGEEPRTNTDSIAKVMKNRGMPPILHKAIPTDA
ncbi:MAG: hypothetical protein ABI137_16100 [Antricoccus sp.]